jgi:mono/diheme cytochrome c family protein
MANSLAPVLLLGVLALCGCRRDMADQPKLKPLAASNFFADGAASRTAPAHTVSREDLPESPFSTGRERGELVKESPVPISAALLARGRERYDIYCSVCHGRTGEGHGMIVQRGFPTPPSLHDPRLRAAPAGHYFDVITHGFGLMYPYASRVAPADRWAIVAYIRALQLSEHANLADAAPEGRAQLEAEKP